MRISEILSKYETDKVTGHCYGDLYDELFSQFDNKSLLNILEIGVQKGGSLLAWKEYCENATVTGVDILDCRLPEYISDKVSFVLSDIKDYKTENTFDVIIDDGSHFFYDVEYAVKILVPKLKDKGIYVIEDVQDPTSWVYNVRRILPEGFDLEVRDLRHVNGNYDDFIIIIKKQ